MRVRLLLKALRDLVEDVAQKPTETELHDVIAALHNLGLDDLEAVGEAIKNNKPKDALRVGLDGLRKFTPPPAHVPSDEEMAKVIDFLAASPKAAEFAHIFTNLSFAKSYRFAKTLLGGTTLIEGDAERRSLERKLAQDPSDERTRARLDASHARRGGVSDSWFRHFLANYIEIAIERSEDRPGGPGGNDSGSAVKDGEFLDKKLPPKEEAKITKSCRAFVGANEADLVGLNPETAGVDFYMVRSEHQNHGFWNATLPKVEGGERAKRLRTAARREGEQKLELDDNDNLVVV